MVSDSSVGRVSSGDETSSPRGCHPPIHPFSGGRTPYRTGAQRSTRKNCTDRAYHDQWVRGQGQAGPSGCGLGYLGLHCRVSQRAI